MHSNQTHHTIFTYHLSQIILGFLLAWLYLLTTPIYAQTEINQFKYLGENFPELEDQLRDVVKDQEGFLWLAGKKGLYRFDGYEVIHYGTHEKSPIKLSSNDIFDLHLNHKNQLLIATDNGLNTLDLKEQKVTFQFHRQDSIYPSQGINKNRIYQVLVDQRKTTWLSDGGLLASLDTLGKTKYWLRDSIQDVKDLIEAQNGKLILTSWKYDDPVYVFNTEDGTSKAIREDSIKIRGKLVKLENRSDYISLPYQDTIFLIDKLKRISYYFDQKTDQFLLADQQNNTLTAFHKKLQNYATRKNIIKGAYDIYDHAFPNSIYNHQNGKTYIATKGGLFLLTTRQKIFSKISMLDNKSIRGMYKSEDSTLYIGTYSGLYVDPPNQPPYLIEELSNMTKIFQYDDHTLMMPNDGAGLYFFDTKSKKVINNISFESTRGNNIYHSTFDQSKKFWLSNNFNLFTLNPSGDSLLPYVNPENNESTFKGFDITSINPHITNGVWIGSNKGIYHIASNGQVLKHIELQNACTPNQKINGINYIYQKDKNYIWVASLNGLYYLNLTSGCIEKKYSTDNGLPDNHIYSIIPESDQVFWLSTNNGLSRMNINHEQFFNFYEKDGLNENEFNTNAYLRTNEGILYFGGINGVNYFNPSNLDVSKDAPFTLLSSLEQHNNKNRKVIKQYYPNTQEEIILNPGDRFIQFTFTNTNFSTADQNIFEYQLEGYDTKPIYTNDNKIRYTNLKKGSYTFWVRSANEYGIWSNNKIIIPLKVKDYFYNSGLFYLIITMGLIGLFYLFMYYRRIQQQKITNLKEKIANDLHDDLSNTLNNIRMIASSLVTQPIETTRIRREADSIHRMSSEAVERVQDVIWTIDKGEKKIEDLIFKMQDYADDHLRSNDIPFSFNTDQLNLNRAIDFVYRSNILFIFKEAISNAIKHADSKHLTIILSNKTFGFQMKINNYFLDLRESKYSTGKGIKSMRKRAEDINGNLTIKKSEESYEVLLQLNRKL